MMTRFKKKKKTKKEGREEETLLWSDVNPETQREKTSSNQRDKREARERFESEHEIHALVPSYQHYLFILTDLDIYVCFQVCKVFERTDLEPYIYKYIEFLHIRR